MKEKDQYTFEELCENLTIPVSEFCRRARITEGTLARLRQGYSARRVTANKLIETFSQVYGLELSLDKVAGLALEDKKAIRKQMLERKGIVEKAEKQTATAVTVKPIPEKAPKRAYNRKKDLGLPEGCILAIDFARAHGVAPTTFNDHMLLGLGPGLIHGPGVPEDGTVLVKDYVCYEERNKRVRKDGTIEKEKYLTPAQQEAALDFWRRHGVPFTMPEAEQEKKQELAWYMPEQEG